MIVNDVRITMAGDMPMVIPIYKLTAIDDNLDSPDRLARQLRLRAPGSHGMHQD